MTHDWLGFICIRAARGHSAPTHLLPGPAHLVLQVGHGYTYLGSHPGRVRRLCIRGRCCCRSLC